MKLESTTYDEALKIESTTDEERLPTASEIDAVLDALYTPNSNEISDDLESASYNSQIVPTHVS
jgi:hypothetical protein